MTENPFYSRNLGFISEAEQGALINSKVAIAGAGGDGGMLAIQLARLGVGEIRLADPDPFEPENINRQAVCTQKTVGENKAIAVGKYISEINPDIHVATYTDGVTAENVEEFLAGADLLIDETEFTMHSIGVMLAREARKNNISNLMALNIGFGATVTSYHPRGKTLEKMLGLDEKAPLDEIEEQEVALSHWLPYIPPYGDLNTFKVVAAGKKSAPSVAPGVAIAAGTASTQALLHLTKGIPNRRPEPVYAPKFMIVDVMSGESKIIRNGVASHYVHLGKMVVSNMLHRSPKASY